MNARSPLSQADLMPHPMQPRPRVLAAHASQAVFYGWLLGWLAVVMAVACVRLTLIS